MSANLAWLVIVAIGLMGCGKKPESKGGLPQADRAQHPAPGGGATVEVVLAAWQQEDKTAAMNRFLETDWSARPLFTPGSAPALSEAQWVALPYEDRESKRGPLEKRAREMKSLIVAVLQAGRDAAANGDPALARRHFNALRQFGEAVDRPDFTDIVRMMGRAAKKGADREMAKLPN